MLRGLLSEFGIIIAHGIGSAIKLAKKVLACCTAPAGTLVRDARATSGQTGPTRDVTSYNSRCWACDGFGHRRNSRWCPSVQKRSRICSLAGSETAQPIQWWKRKSCAASQRRETKPSSAMVPLIGRNRPLMTQVLPPHRFPQRAAAKTSTSTLNSARVKPETIRRVELGSLFASPMNSSRARM